MYPTFSESDSYRIRYSLFVSITESIRIHICIRTLSVSESEQKYENKYNMSDIRSYPIRFHPYLPLRICYSVWHGTFSIGVSVWTRSPRSDAVIGVPTAHAHAGRARLAMVASSPCWQWARLTTAMHAIAAVGALEPPASPCCQSCSASHCRHPLGCSGILGP